MNVLSCAFIILVTLATSICSSTNSTRQVLKFGSALQDYVMFMPNMEAFTSQFSLCAWVRKSWIGGVPHWFYYSTTYTRDELRISDDGYNNIFNGPELNKRKQLGITPGTWYHYCMCWNYSSRTADIYYNGVKVGSIITPSGRRLQTGGFLVLGQYQSYGRRIHTSASGHTFGGELFKLNMFSKKFTADEVSAMYHAGICSDKEKIHGSYRRLTWESIIQQTRNGNVQLVNVDIGELDKICPLQEDLVFVEDQLAKARRELESVKEQSNRKQTEISEMRERAALKTEKLDQTQTELNATKDDLRQSQSELQTIKNGSKEKITNIEALLNQTQTDLQAAENELGKTKINLEQRLNRTQSELNQTRTELNTTRADLGVTKSYLTQTQTALNTTKADLEQKLKQTQTELEKAQALSELYKIGISETEIFSANMSRELESANNKLDVTKSELELTKTELNFTKAELDLTKTELSLTKEDVEEIETNLFQTRKNLETSVNETRSDLDEMLVEQNQNKKRLEKTTQDLDMLKLQLEKTRHRLNQTLAGLEEQTSDIPDCEVAAANISSELAVTKLELQKKEEELEKKEGELERLRGAMSGEDSLGETSCSHWDILYNHCYFNNVLTEEKFASLNKVWEKLEYLKGVTMTRGLIEFLKNFVIIEEQCEV